MMGAFGTRGEEPPMQATNEIRHILAKGQAKAGANPLAVLDGIMSGDAL